MFVWFICGSSSSSYSSSEQWTGVAGGVGANLRLRQRLDAGAAKLGARVFYPPLALCTDNGAMIALAAALRLQHGLAVLETEGAFDVRPRWPLAELSGEVLAVA